MKILTQYFAGKLTYGGNLVLYFQNPNLEAMLGTIDTLLTSYTLEHLRKTNRFLLSKVLHFHTGITMFHLIEKP